MTESFLICLHDWLILGLCEGAHSVNPRRQNEGIKMETSSLTFLRLLVKLHAREKKD